MMGVSVTLVGNAVGVLWIVGGSEGKLAWVSGGEGVVVLAPAAVALVLGRAWLSLPCCNSPVDCFQQAFVAVLQPR